METGIKTSVLQIDERATEAYWEKRKIDWNQAYFTPDHFHRKQIVDCLKDKYFDSILEVGCGAGANLYRISVQEDFGSLKVMGCDINEDAIVEAKKHLPNGIFKQGMAESIPFEDKCADVVLTDACLIYVPPEKIETAKEELLRVARKYIICCEWHGNDIFDGHWVYNYEKLFNEYPMKLTKINKWPGGWEQYGTVACVEIESKR